MAAGEGIPATMQEKASRSQGREIMTVTDLIENEDGSATLKLDLTDNEVQILLEIGLLKLLTDYMEREENDEPHT
jgi:hypothetical protein